MSPQLGPSLAATLPTHLGVRRVLFGPIRPRAAGIPHPAPLYLRRPDSRFGLIPTADQPKVDRPITPGAETAGSRSSREAAGCRIPYGASGCVPLVGVVVAAVEGHLGEAGAVGVGCVDVRSGGG